MPAVKRLLHKQPLTIFCSKIGMALQTSTLPLSHGSVRHRESLFVGHDSTNTSYVWCAEVISGE